MSGTCSIFIKVAASSRARTFGSANVPLVAYTSIMGIVVLPLPILELDGQRSLESFDSFWLGWAHALCAELDMLDWLDGRSAVRTLSNRVI